MACNMFYHTFIHTCILNHLCASAPGERRGLVEEERTVGRQRELGGCSVGVTIY